MLEQMESLSGYGLNKEQIADFFGWSITKFNEVTKKNNAVEQSLKKGKALAIAKASQICFQLATDKKKPNVTMLIFWLKTQARWTEDKSVNIQSNDGKLVIDFSGKNLPE